MYDGAAWGLSIEIGDVAVMVAATALAAGSSGIVPAPQAGQQSFVLTGGATYQDAVSLIPLYQGATTTDAGVRGLVPPASIADMSKVLSGSGAWVESSGVDMGDIAGMDTSTAELYVLIEDTGSYLFRLDADNNWLEVVNDNHVFSNDMSAYLMRAHQGTLTADEAIGLL